MLFLTILSWNAFFTGGEVGGWGGRGVTENYVPSVCLPIYPSVFLLLLLLRVSVQNDYWFIDGRLHCTTKTNHVQTVHLLQTFPTVPARYTGQRKQICVQTHTRFKRTLFIRTKTQPAHFRSNPLYQATKRHLNNS